MPHASTHIFRATYLFCLTFSLKSTTSTNSSGNIQIHLIQPSSIIATTTSSSGISVIQPPSTLTLTAPKNIIKSTNISSPTINSPNTTALNVAQLTKSTANPASANSSASNPASSNSSLCFLMYSTIVYLGFEIDGNLCVLQI